MPNRPRRRSSLRVAKTTKQGTFRGINKSKTGHRIELYSAAYKLALEQIPPFRCASAGYVFAHSCFY
jgi:hypothetical protein